jgi:hypothetical protein
MSLVCQGQKVIDMIFVACNMDGMNTDWKQIEAAGLELGVGFWAVKKWRQRGIPYKYHVPLAQRLGVKIDDLYAMRQKDD